MRNKSSISTASFVPVADAQVSVLDRGFIYGDGVYEVVPLYGREPFRLPQHLARLQRSLDGIGLANPHTAAQWEALIRDLAARQPFADQGVYFQVTRGAAKRDHAFPKGVPPTVFMMSNPLPTPTREQVERGVAVVTAEDNRWHRCDLKTISLLGNVLLRQLAAEQGAAETVLFRDGFLTEASASNVLIVQDGTIIVPPKDNLILPGITYDATMEFAREARIPLERCVRCRRRRRSPPPRCGCPRRRKRCSRSRPSTASPSPAASRAPCFARCGKSSRRESRARLPARDAMCLWARL